MNDRFDPRKLYDIYKVDIQFRGRLYGGVPKNKELIRDWLVAKTGHDDEITSELAEDAKEKMIDEVTEKSWNGFYRDEERGIFIAGLELPQPIRDRLINGHSRPPAEKPI